MTAPIKANMQHIAEESGLVFVGGEGAPVLHGLVCFSARSPVFTKWSCEMLHVYQLICFVFTKLGPRGWRRLITVLQL